ncbi:MAG: dihydropteroate synthase [Ignavibacteriae bacterium]|nr:dihydropteroate synthase [Ignavibacteriota bacterium]
MGIINITPDSFSDGGKYFDGKINFDRILQDALKMEKDGADFIDIGGESTRPGSEKISKEEELERVIPAIELIKINSNVLISIDTYKSEVAEEALKTGADIVNDISGFRFDKNIAKVTAKYNATCILMHINGTPKNMQENPVYKNVVEEVYNYLSDSISIAKNAGIKQIITDVGIGFGKNLQNNLDLIKNLSEFKKLGYPILLGVSRKRFIDNISPTHINERLEGTIAANVAGILNGANIIRVHDVLENKKAALIADNLK